MGLQRFYHIAIVEIVKSEGFANIMKCIPIVCPILEIKDSPPYKNRFNVCLSATHDLLENG